MLVGHFCDLVDDYDRLGAAFPVGVASYELDSTSPLGAAERWHRVVRSMALRKFVLGANDHVRADKVLSALRRCMPHSDDRRLLERWQADFDSIGTRIQVDEGADARRSLAEILEDLIYGSYLHGDLDRFQRTHDRSQATVDLALYMFSEDAEFYIRRLRSVILLAAAEGRLNAVATEVLRSRAQD